MRKLLIFLLFFVLTSQAQIEKTQYRLIQCPLEHCISAPVYDGDQIYYIDTSNGKDEFSGDKIFYNNEEFEEWYIYYDNIKQVSNLQLDQFGRAVGQIDDVIVRIPPSRPVEVLITINDAYPIKTNSFQKNDVSSKLFYLANSPCESDGEGEQIVSASMSTSNKVDDMRSLRLERPEIIADSCQDMPEPFFNTRFIRVSPSEKHIIYNIEVSSISSSRLYYRRSDGINFPIADSAIAADVNDNGFAAWAIVNHINESIDFYITELTKGETQLISQIPIEKDSFVMVPEMYIDDSNNMSFLMQTYHFISQNFTFDLYASFANNNTHSLVLSTGDIIDGREIDTIRWNKHGFRDPNVLAASVRYQDGFEAIIKVFDNDNTTVGYNLDRVALNSDGEHILTVNQRTNESTKLKINTTSPVLATTTIPMTYTRNIDKITRESNTTMPIARKTVYASVPEFPVLPDNPPSYEFDITMNPSSPEITLRPPSSIKMNVIRNLNNQGQCNDDIISDICIFACVKQVLNIIVPPDRKGVVNVYERLRDDYIANTLAGQYYLQMYNINVDVLKNAMFSEPTSAWKFLSLFNTWEPAIVNLLEGDGSFQISQDMTLILNESLDIISRNVSEPFKSKIYDAREKMHLYEATNKTILELMMDEFEPSFEDLIFSHDFS